MDVKFAPFKLTLGPTRYPLIVTTYGALSGWRGVPVIAPDRTL